MAHTTSDFRRSPYKRGFPRQASASTESCNDLAALIDDTIRMIENTHSFLDRLDHSQIASREAVACSCQRLEEALEALKRRQRALAGYDC